MPLLKVYVTGKSTLNKQKKWAKIQWTQIHWRNYGAGAAIKFL